MPRLSTERRICGMDPTTSEPLLERHRIFTSRDTEATRAFLRGKEFRFEIAPRDVAELDAHINGVYLPGIFIGYIQYGAPVTVRATLARDLHFAVGELECDDSMLWEPSAMARFEELLVTGLLLSHPHSYSEALRRLAHPVAPRDVRRAVDCMRSRLGDELSLADIVEQ